MFSEYFRDLEKQLIKKYKGAGKVSTPKKTKKGVFYERKLFKSVFSSFIWGLVHCRVSPRF